jgi:hypothetical protein
MNRFVNKRVTRVLVTLALVGIQGAPLTEISG